MLWKVSFINPASGVTTVSGADVNCTDIQPEIGITATPVIDTTTHTIYDLARTKENGSFFQRLHAIDTVTGAEKFGGPVVIHASVPGTGDGSVKRRAPGSGAFPLLDYFTPYNQAALSSGDLDLGAGGPLLLPDLPAGSAHPHLLALAGKEGTIYLINRDNLGHYCNGCSS